MHTTPQPRQPARIIGGAEPTFWGRDHLVFCPIFGGRRGLRGCKRCVQQNGKNMYSDYFHLFKAYINKEISVVEFEREFTSKWRYDRDHLTIYDKRFHRIIDRIFTSLDTYDDPDIDEHFDESSLYNEVQLLSYIWYGE